MTTPWQPLAIAQILREESQRHHIKIADILGRSRHASIVPARHATWRRVRDELKLSLPKIGKLFHRHHCTIGYALAKMGGGAKYGAGPK